MEDAGRHREEILALEIKLQLAVESVFAELPAEYPASEVRGQNPSRRGQNRCSEPLSSKILVQRGIRQSGETACRLHVSKIQVLCSNWDGQ